MNKVAQHRPWKAIAAMAENRVIGRDNQLPWNIPEDLQWLKQCTRGQAIAMGRATYESMGKPLPGRENIVISRTLKSLQGCVVLPSLDALLQYESSRSQTWIFGGAQIYAAALDHIHELMLTVVKGSYEGDTFFPPFEDRFRLAEVVREHPQFRILRYVPDDVD
jgi:dihydrofolate reductase